ncbi:MAG: hypothetical protein N2043_08875 [Ignavibacterium sp.]|nr:hypothetical protein [Ignavibacterium sp.]
MTENKIKIPLSRRIFRYSVNTFLYFFIFLLIILLFVFIISQTNAFKNWLKYQIVQLVNDQINGKISIGKLDGTIFTSIELYDVTLLNKDQDTVAYFSNFTLKTSPLKILFKDIHIRKIELKNAYLNLFEESDGELNLIKIFPSSDEPDDTTGTEFPFTISVADFEINNLNIVYQSFENRGSLKSHRFLNTDDIRISNLILSLDGFANIKKQDYRVNIRQLNFQSNLELFQLQNFSGNFLLTKNGAMIDQLNIETLNSKLSLSCAISEIDFIKNFTLESLENAPLRTSLYIEKFNFNDLSSFVSSTNFLNGDLSGEVSVYGNLNNLYVDKLNIKKGNTYIISKANLQNILKDDKFTINAQFDNSIVDMEDVGKLLGEKSITKYNLGQIKLSKLNFKGKPTEFNSEISLASSLGELSVIGLFNFNLKNPKYDLTIKTKNLNLYPFINLETSFNTEAKIIGEGFDLESIKTKLKLNSDNSRFEDFKIYSLELNTEINDKILSFDFNTKSDTTNIFINGKIDFIRENDPYFNLVAQVKSFDISDIIKDSLLASNINTNIDIEGRGFDIDSMNIFLLMDLDKTKISNFTIDSTKLILDVRRNDNGNKVLNLVSNVADFTISGNYKLSSLINTLKAEGDLVINQIKDKLSKSLEIDFQRDSSIVAQFRSFNNQIFDARLLLDFKDFVPIALDENNSIEIGGEIRGSLISREDNIQLNLDSDINYLKVLSKNDFYFITKSLIKLNLKQFITLQENFKTEFFFNLNSDRVYFGNNIYDLSTDLSLISDTLNFAFQGTLEDFLEFDFSSNNLFNNEEFVSNIKKINLIYNNVPISNNKFLKLKYSKGNIFFDNFELNIEQGRFNINGYFGKNDGQLNFQLVDLKSDELINKILEISPSNNIASNINLSGKVTGNFENPVISLDSKIDDIIINNVPYGNIKSNIEYSNDKITLDFKFFENISNNLIEKLSIEGTIPLKEQKTQKELSNDNAIDLRVLVDDMSLKPIGKLFTEVEIKFGDLESEIFIKGTIKNPYVVGYLNINDLNIRPFFNNIDYFLNASLYWEDELISIEKFTIKNDANIKFGGVLRGDGFIKLSEFEPDSLFISANGNIKILDQISKEVNQFIYGDLSLSTKSDITFSLNKDEININLPLNITKADLVLPLPRTAYTNTSDIIYRFAESVEKSEVETELEKLIKEYEEKRIKNVQTNGSRELNYQIDVSISDEAKVVLILSRELNQDLTALLSGNIILSSKDGITRTSGQFNLLEGSRLSFIKSFEARGNVRFENLNNPLIDITAIYRDYYYPITETGQSTEQEVAVKIKLKGPLSELNQNFVKDPENIGVYVGTENIQKDQRDETKTPTDALFFIIAGKFTDGATLQERNTVASTATSFAGSLIGNVLNQYLGDYVRSVQLRQFGDQTKFSLIGKVGNFRYEIGGTTEVFQDLSRANVKIELPIKQKLILRLERKESFSDQSTLNAYLYNEFGIKYKFEF